MPWGYYSLTRGHRAKHNICVKGARHLSECCSTQHIDFHVTEHLGWSAMTKKNKTFIICPKLLGNCFSNCPNVLKHEDIFRMPKSFGQK
jgi:hypothetical protein